MSESSRPETSPGRRTLSETASKAIVSAWGVPLPREETASDASGAARAAVRIGFPVVLKLVGDGIAHKTERGLVRLGLRDAVIFGIPGVNVAKTISFIAGTTTAYLINRRWTFQAAASKARFIAVIVLYALTYGVQVGINYLLYLKFQGQPWGVPVAFVIAQGTATVINFIVQRAWIFRLR